MGTKAIEAVLQRAMLRETSEEKEQVIRAMHELRAIEEAARFLTENRAKNRLAEYVSGGKDWARACALMERIAKEEA